MQDDKPSKHSQGHRVSIRPINNKLHFVKKKLDKGHGNSKDNVSAIVVTLLHIFLFLRK